MTPDQIKDALTEWLDNGARGSFSFVGALNSGKRASKSFC